MNKKTFVIIAFAFALMLVLASRLYSGISKEADAVPPASQSAPASEKEFTPAPDFTMQDADGGSVTLSEHLGKPLVLNFWASWCGPCKNEMPFFDAAAAEYEGSVDFMMVNLTDSDTVDNASKLISDKGYTFPVYYDTQGAGATAYYVRSIPMTFFIDSDGSIVSYHTGAMSEDSLNQAIEQILP